MPEPFFLFKIFIYAFYLIKINMLVINRIWDLRLEFFRLWNMSRRWSQLIYWIWTGAGVGLYSKNTPKTTFLGSSAGSYLKYNMKLDLKCSSSIKLKIWTIKLAFLVLKSEKNWFLLCKIITRRGVGGYIRNFVVLQPLIVEMSFLYSSIENRLLNISVS